MPKRTTYKQQYQKELQKLEKALTSQHYFYGKYELPTAPKRVGRKQVESIKQMTADVKKLAKRVKAIETKGYDFYSTPIGLSGKLTKGTTKRALEKYTTTQLYRQSRYYVGAPEEGGNPYIKGTQALAMERSFKAKAAAQTRRSNEIRKIINENDWLVRKTARDIDDELYFDEDGKVTGFGYEKEEVQRQAKQQLFDKYSAYVKATPSELRRFLENERDDYYSRLRREYEQSEAYRQGYEQTQKLLEELEEDDDWKRIQSYDDDTINDLLNEEPITQPLPTQSESFTRENWAKENGYTIVDPTTGEILPVDPETGEILYPQETDMIINSIQSLFDMIDRAKEYWSNDDSGYVAHKKEELADRLKERLNQLIEATGKITAAANIQRNASAINEMVSTIMYKNYDGSYEYDPAGDIITLENIIVYG